MIICFIELVCGQRHRSEVAKLCYLGPVPLSTTQFYEAYDHEGCGSFIVDSFVHMWTESGKRD